MNRLGPARSRCQRSTTKLTSMAAALTSDQTLKERVEGCARYSAVIGVVHGSVEGPLQLASSVVGSPLGA